MYDDTNVNRLERSITISIEPQEQRNRKRENESKV
jgi:hypothetical protein